MRGGGKQANSLKQRIQVRLQHRPAATAANGALHTPKVRPVASESPIKQRKSPRQDPETAASPYEELEDSTLKARSFRKRLAGQSCEMTTRQVHLRISGDGREILNPERSSPKQVSLSLLDVSLSSLQTPEHDLEATLHRLWPTARYVPKPVPAKPPRRVLCVQGDQCVFYELL